MFSIHLWIHECRCGVSRFPLCPHANDMCTSETFLLWFYWVVSVPELNQATHTISGDRPSLSEYVISCSSTSVSWIFMVFLIRRLSSQLETSKSFLLIWLYVWRVCDGVSLCVSSHQCSGEELGCCGEKRRGNSTLRGRNKQERCQNSKCFYCVFRISICQTF